MRAHTAAAICLMLLVCPLGGQTRSPVDHASSSLRRAKPLVLVSGTGEIVVTSGVETLGGVQFGLQTDNWSNGFSSQDRATRVRAWTEGGARILDGSIEVPGNGSRSMRFHQEVRAVGDRELAIRYRFRFAEAVSINQFYLAFQFRIAPHVGQEIAVTGSQERRFLVRAAPGEPVLMVGRGAAIAVSRDKPHGVSFVNNEETDLWLQDNRAWAGEIMEARFRHVVSESRTTLPAGTEIEQTCTLRFNCPVQVALSEDDPEPADTKGWAPWSVPAGVCPTDVSALNETPAGTHGHVVARGAGLAFFDGARARFWGVHLAGPACVPDQSESERLARRIAASGANIVRFTGLWPSLADSSGGGDPDSPAPARLERFDALVSRLKRVGVYILLEVPLDVGDDRGPAQARALLQHVNPYTKMAYKDDPVLALMEIVLRKGFFTSAAAGGADPVALERKLRTWAAANGVSIPTGQVDFSAPSPDVVRFLIAEERARYTAAYHALRKAGARVPIAGSAWCDSAAQIAALTAVDLPGVHAYWDHPSGRLAGEDARPLVLTSGSFTATGLAFGHLAGRPSLLSCAGSNWTGEYRAEEPLALAMTAALHGWDGLIASTYSRGPTATGRFVPGTAADPAWAALAPHAALLFRRDARAATKRYTVVLPEKDVLEKSASSAWEYPPFLGGAEVHGLRIAIGATPPGSAPVAAADERIVDRSADPLVSDTGEHIVGKARPLGQINTAGTQAVYGLPGACGVVLLGDVEITARTTYAAIAVSSLTAEPIASSRRLLLSAVGRSENTGTVYNVLHNRRLRAGGAPVLFEPVRADLRLRTARPLRVLPILADGTRGAAIPASHRDGWLQFRIGEAPHTMHYELAP